MTVDELRTEMHAEFDKVHAEFDKVHAEFERVDAEFAKLRAEIKAEGETTRRHMDIIGEQMRDLVRVVAEGAAANSVRLEDHETRITRLETR
jgi:hypothetical protein